MLRIFLLGPVRICHSESSQRIQLSRSLQALLGYLLLQRPRLQPREVLSDLFWGEQPADRARSCLSTALWRLRTTLEPAGTQRGTYLITTSAGDIGFNWESPHWLDLQAFEEALEWAHSKQLSGRLESAVISRMEEALRLYSGELLEGLYADWVLRAREQRYHLYMEGLKQLMRHYTATGNLAQSLVYGHQILNADPLQEEIQREVMRLYLHTGQRALAIRQYQICRDVLAGELGIAPMPETQALLREITADHLPAAVPASTTPPAQSLPDALQQLRTAVQILEQAQVSLREAIQIVEKYAVKG